LVYRRLCKSRERGGKEKEKEIEETKRKGEEKEKKEKKYIFACEREITQIVGKG